jgi:hypothetical protein
MVFGLIYSKCSEVIQKNLERDNKYVRMEMEDDVVGLLKKLKAWAFLTEGTKHPVLVVQQSMQSMINVNQSPMEGVANYYGRFMAQVEVNETHWGPLVPPMMVTATPNIRIERGDPNDPDSDVVVVDLGPVDAQKKELREAFLAMLLFDQSDTKRFGKLKDATNNQYLAGVDNYPKTLDSALTLLLNYKDYQSGGSASGGGNMHGTQAASFAQQGRRLNLATTRCFNCNEMGHVAATCPRPPRPRGPNWHFNQTEDGPPARPASPAPDAA